MSSFNVTVDDSSPLISYSPAGVWNDSRGSADASGYASGSYHYAEVQGASSTVSFTGTGIWLYGAFAPGYGAYSLAVDGKVVTSGSATSRSLQLGQLLGGAGGLAMGTHTAVLTSTDGAGVDLDSFVFETQTGVAGIVSNATVDDMDPAFTYGGPSTAVWQTNSAAGFHDNTLHFSDSGSAQATYAFSGEAIAVYGTSSPDHGDLQVQIDGGAAQTVAPYAGVSFLHDQTLLYFGTNLGAGQHTLTLTGNPGQTNVTTGKFMDIDYVQVYSSAGSAVGSVAGPTAGSAAGSTAGSAADHNVSNTSSAKPSAAAGSKTDIGAIVGGVVGGVVALLLFLLAFFLYRRRRQAAIARRSFHTSPATPALPFQFSSSPVDPEKQAGLGPRVLVPTFAAAPMMKAAVPPSLRAPIANERKGSSDTMHTFGSRDDVPLIARPDPYNLPRMPPPSMPRAMPSRNDAQMAQVASLRSAVPMRPASPAMSLEKRSNSPGLRANRPPSLLLATVDMPPPARPSRPARPENPHLSVLADRRGPSRPSRPASPNLSEIDQPVPGRSENFKRRATRRATGRDSMQTIGIVGFYTDSSP